MLATIANLYDQLPDFDPVAVPSFSCLRDEVLRLFDLILRPVIFQSENPYNSSKELFADLDQDLGNPLRVFSGGNQHPFLSNEENCKFRAVHDWFGHYQGRAGFGWKGEVRSYQLHLSQFHPDSHPALLTETLGQVSWYFHFGSYPQQKVGLLHVSEEHLPRPR